jgi:hypothetical protein
MHCPSHSSRFDHMNNTWRGAQIIKLHILYFSPLPCALAPSGLWNCEMFLHINFINSSECHLWLSCMFFLKEFNSFSIVLIRVI